ncbi:hypothetical protein C1H46_023408 [Malus baccata]|uniref:Uncharacterized protein n=1 Tax=Malus baccata TaxID=106549 RepID=A0A540LWZ1_MALBA|nr:hypothetical protein C1H46_023408 [Malus baccata]
MANTRTSSLFLFLDDQHAYIQPHFLPTMTNTRTMGENRNFTVQQRKKAENWTANEGHFRHSTVNEQ